MSELARAEQAGQADEHPGQSKADELEEEEKAVAASGLSTKMHDMPDQPTTNYLINQCMMSCRKN